MSHRRALVSHFGLIQAQAGPRLQAPHVAIDAVVGGLQRLGALPYRVGRSVRRGPDEEGAGGLLRLLLLLPRHK